MLVIAAVEFEAIAGDPQIVDDRVAFRARLRPILARLETIPSRFVEGKAIAQGFSEAAEVASSRAVRGERLCDAGEPGRFLQAVYDGMNDFGATDEQAQHLDYSEC